MKEKITNTILDLVSNFIYYDRKEDESLPRGEIEKAVENGIITVDEMINIFATELKKQFD